MKKLLVLAVAFVLLASSVGHARLSYDGGSDGGYYDKRYSDSWSPWSWLTNIYHSIFHPPSSSSPSNTITKTRTKTTTPDAGGGGSSGFGGSDSSVGSQPGAAGSYQRPSQKSAKSCVDECQTAATCHHNLGPGSVCCAPDKDHPCNYCAFRCGSGEQEKKDQCQVNSDCGAGRYCCASPNGNICRDCPCNQNTCNNNGGGGSSGVSSIGGSTCDVSRASGVSVSPSYNFSAITWAHGNNDHQELYVDTDRAKVLANCANGCLLKKTGLGSGVDAYTVSGLQPGTKYYYRIRSVKACGSAEADGSFSTIPELVVSEADYTNNQKLGKETPPAVVRCHINHNDNGALYAVVGGKKLKRLEAPSQAGDSTLAYFLPDLTPGTHEAQCKVDRSKAMGSGSAVSYTIEGPSVSLEAGNAVVGMPSSVFANASSDFFINSTAIFVDGKLVDDADFKGKHMLNAVQEFHLPLLPGRHSISVLVKDYVGNTASASVLTNVTDGPVSCVISPGEIDSDTDLAVDCYSSSGSKTTCPRMTFRLDDPHAGTLDGESFDYNESYCGITTIVADSGSFECAASVVGNEVCNSGNETGNGTGIAPGSGGYHLDLMLSSKKYFKGEPVVGKVVVYRNGIPVDPMNLENPMVVVDKGTPFEKVLGIGKGR